MAVICDVNFLLALLSEQHIHAEKANAWMQTIGEPRHVGIARCTLVAVLRLLNNPAAMAERVCTGKQAWDLIELLLEDDRFEVIADPADTDGHFKALTHRLKYSHGVWPDAFLASIAIASGRSLVTFDRGFQKFAGLKLKLIS